MTYELLIIYSDGQEKTINTVSEYGCKSEQNIFYYVKNGYRSFIPIAEVKFFGRKFDYEN